MLLEGFQPQALDQLMPLGGGMDAVGGVVGGLLLGLSVKDLIQREVGVGVLVGQLLDNGLLAGKLLRVGLLGRVHGLQQEGLDHEDAGVCTGLEGIQDYNDRTQCTQQGVGGLPDVNTENPKFQKYYMEFVNKLVKMGVRGFRYDTAKHIGVHSDPIDTEAGVTENDFWDVATGRKEVLGVSLAIPYDSLFVYGEVLQDRNVPEEEYAGYFGQTASTYGHVLREVLAKRSAKDIDLISWYHRAAPEYLTTWVESHDTYCNANESAGLTDAQIRTGWVFLTARQNGTPLFYSRPMNSTRENYWGDNLLGARGNDEFFHPEVVAVNKFRQSMEGQVEDIQIAPDGEVVVVNRGDKGAAIINFSLSENEVQLPTSLPAGEYKDQVYGKTFKVEDGILKGKAAPETTYVIVK